MRVLQIEWEAKASGIYKVDLDEIGLSTEEWNEFSYDAQLDIITQALEDEDDLRPFPEPDVWEIVEDER